MSKKVEIKLNGKAISDQLLKGDWIDSVMEEIAEDIISKCSGSYEIETFPGKKRDNVAIITNDRRTYHTNLKTNELLKSLGGSK